MKINFTPFLKGVDRSVDDVAQGPSGLRDCMNVISQATGRLDGLYMGQAVRAVASGTPTRWKQWGDYTIIMQNNPTTSNIGFSDGSTFTSYNRTGEARGCVYDSVFALGAPNEQAGIQTQAGVLLSTVFIGLDAGNGWGQISGAITGGPTYTVNFATNLPVIPSGKTARYILFDSDADIGATSALTRPITSVTGSPITSVDFTGAPPSSPTYAFIIFGDSATDTFKPHGFATYRNRLAAWLENEVYFAGFIGQPDPFIEPQPQNWAYWYELNSVTVGHSGQGSIVRCEPLGDSLFVFLENATYQIYGYPPINGAYDNQLVVREISSNLGISTYDGVCRAVDGQSLYVIGSDGDLYQFNGAYQTISDTIKLHPRFTGLTHCSATDQYVVFTGVTPTPESVPGELYPRDCGLIYQTPATFCWNIEKREFTILDQYGLNSTQDLIPFTDPYELGVFGAFEVDGEVLLAMSEPGSIKVINDKDLRSPAVTDAFCMGVATHQIPVNQGQFRPDTVVALADGSYSARLPVCVNAENPAGSAPLQKARDIPISTFGTTSRYAVHASAPDPHNYLSCAVGYWGEKLIAGASDYSASRTAITIDGTPTLQKFTVGGAIDRIDVLLSGITSARLTIYEGTASTPDLTSPVFGVDVTEPKNGLINNATPYWRSFAIGLPAVDTPYWVALTGNCTAYRYPANASIYKSGSIIHNGYSFMMRVIQEAGGAYAAKALLSVSVDGESLPNAY